MNVAVIRLRQMNIIAQWNVYASKKGGPRQEVCAKLHRPEVDPKSKHGDFRTLAHLDGISKCRHKMGVNSMQSLVLGISMLQLQVECAMADGWIFFFDETATEPFDLLGAITPPSHATRDSHPPEE